MADMSVSLQMNSIIRFHGQVKGHLGQHTSQFRVEPNPNLLKSPTKDKEAEIAACYTGTFLPLSNSIFCFAMERFKRKPLQTRKSQPVILESFCEKGCWNLSNCQALLTWYATTLHSEDNLGQADIHLMMSPLCPDGESPPKVCMRLLASASHKMHVWSPELVRIWASWSGT